MNLSAHCEHYWIRISVDEDTGYTPSQRDYVVDIEVLMEDDGTCSDSGLIGYNVFGINGCNINYDLQANLQSVKAVDTTKPGCFGLNRFANYPLYKKYYRGHFSLDSFQCINTVVYCERGSQSFANIAGADTLPVPVAGWVKINTSFGTNDPALTDSTFEVMQACGGKPKFFQPVFADSDPADSIEMRMANPVLYKNLDSTNPAAYLRYFNLLLNINKPIPSSNFQVDIRKINFTPTDTGLMVIPMFIKEWRFSNNGAIGWLNHYQSYWQLPVFVSDSCFSNLGALPAFHGDTLFPRCDTIFTLPLAHPVATASISADGSDFKFHNANGYPVFVNKAYAQGPNTSYTDSITVEAQFLFDGLYEIELVAGADGNRLISECGYELQGGQRIPVKVKGCGTTGEKEASLATGLEVFPNPASDRAEVRHSEGVKSLQLFNAVGDKVLEVETSGEKTGLNLSKLGPGLYFLRSVGQGSAEVKKLLIGPHIP